MQGQITSEPKVTLPSMEPAFARTLLGAARRDATAMAQAYGIAPADKHGWTVVAQKIQRLIDGLPDGGDVPPVSPAPDLEDLFG